MNDLIEVNRSSVQTWETDQMGHMNVQFYMEKATQGLASLGIHLGLGPRRLESQGTTLHARSHHVRFLREQRPGAAFYMRAGVLSVRADSLKIYQEMISTTTGEVAATFTGDVDLLDITTQQPRPLPTEAIDRARDLTAEQPARGRARGLELYEPRPAPTLEEAQRLGMVPTLQCEIQPAQCAADGYLHPRHYMGIVSDSIPNLLAQTQGRDRGDDSDVGGAALEYRFIYRARPRAGDVLALRSGLKEVGSKTYIWVHWLFDLESGRCVATAEAVAITLDLTARKSVPIPDEMRARLETLLNTELSV